MAFCLYGFAMAQESPSRAMDKVIVRLPDGMRDRIKAAAEANNRSMNAEIVATLEEKYPAPRRWFDSQKWAAHIALVEKRSKEILARMQEIVVSYPAAVNSEMVKALDDEFSSLSLEHDALWSYNIEDDRFYIDPDDYDLNDAPTAPPCPPGLTPKK